MTRLPPRIAYPAIGILAAILWALILWPALAQTPPQGLGTLNQGISARLLTKSDTTIFQKTRGLYIGDATTCNITVRFASDTVAQVVALNSLQPGELLPIQVIQLMAATTCASVVAIY